jgi:hypothetical protein
MAPDSERADDASRLRGVARHTEGDKGLLDLTYGPDLVLRAGPSSTDGSTWLGAVPAATQPGDLVGRWRHIKGGVYDFVARAVDAAGSPLVIYTDPDGEVWARPEAMIHEVVSREGRRGPRFQRLETD